MAVPAHDGKGPLFALMSYALASDPWRKATHRRYSYGGHASHVEMVGWQAGFFAQSSALITYLLTLNL